MNREKLFPFQHTGVILTPKTAIWQTVCKERYNGISNLASFFLPFWSKMASFVVTRYITYLLLFKVIPAK